jgi:hypothetical protein
MRLFSRFISLRLRHGALPVVFVGVLVLVALSACTQRSNLSDDVATATADSLAGVDDVVARARIRGAALREMSLLAAKNPKQRPELLEMRERMLRDPAFVADMHSAREVLARATGGFHPTAGDLDMVQQSHQPQPGEK